MPSVVLYSLGCLYVGVGLLILFTLLAGVAPVGKIFRVAFQRYSLKFHTKYLTHTLKEVDFCTTLKFEELLDLRAHTRF